MDYIAACISGRRSCCGKRGKRESELKLLRETNATLVFQEPAKCLAVAGGSTGFYRLIVREASDGIALVKKDLTSWVGKELATTLDEVGFYRRAQGLNKSNDWKLLSHMLKFGGTLMDFTVVHEGGTEDALDLLVLECLIHGLCTPRLIDLKIGSLTAAANWKGKSVLASWRQRVLDSHTNSALEGVRLEGFLNPPEWVRSEEDPLVDLGKSGWFMSKKTFRLAYQRKHMQEVLQAFTDLRHLGGKDVGNTNQRLLPAEFSEIVLIDCLRQLAEILHDCQEVPVPQKWVGSSVCIVMDAGQPPERCVSPGNARNIARVRLLDWGRSELSLPSDHKGFSEQERRDRSRFWDMYQAGILKATWEATWLYWNTFCVEKWHRLRISLFDYSFTKRNGFLGSADFVLPDPHDAVSPAAKMLTLIDDKGAKITSRDGKTAEVKVSISFSAYPKPSRLLGAWHVEVHYARNLRSADHGVTSSSSDPFAVATMFEDFGGSTNEVGGGGPPRSAEVRTKVVPRTVDPVWNETMEFPVVLPTNDDSCDVDPGSVAGPTLLEQALVPTSVQRRRRFEKEVIRIRVLREASNAVGEAADCAPGGDGMDEADEELPPVRKASKHHAWMVRLKRKEGTELGFDFDPETLQILTIHPEGALFQYNQRHLASAVDVGDCIAEANSKSIMKHGAEAVVLEFTQRNHHDIWMRVIREGADSVLVTLGLGEDPASGSNFLGPPRGPGLGLDPETLKITSLEPSGLIAEWNVACPDRMVHVGDRVVEVNGKHIAQAGMSTVLSELHKNRGRSTKLVSFIANVGQANDEQEFLEEFFQHSKH